MASIYTGEPFRATRIWIDLVQLFCTGVPRKRHWKRMKTYDNSFTGEEAVQWFHKTLQSHPCFGSAVTKEQVSQLLSKFLKAGVFKDVSVSQEKGFVEYKHVYVLNEEIFNDRIPFNDISIKGLMNIHPVNAKEDKAKVTASESVTKSLNVESGVQPLNVLKVDGYNKWNPDTTKHRVYKRSKPKKPLNSNDISNVINIKSENMVHYKNPSKYLFQKMIEPDCYDGAEMQQDIRKAHFSLCKSRMNQYEFNPSFGLSANNNNKKSNTSSALGKDKIDYQEENYIWYSTVMSRLKAMDEKSISELCLVCPEWVALNAKRNLNEIRCRDTFFPHNIFAILSRSVQGCSEFPQNDVNRIVDYILRLTIPVVSLEVLTCATQLFAYLEDMKSRKSSDALSLCGASSSLENLLLEMTHSNIIIAEEDKTHFNIDKSLSKTLPPNYCYETAFTSDDPITRIIPQSSVDSVHLFSKKACAKKDTDQSSYFKKSERKLKRTPSMPPLPYSGSHHSQSKFNPCDIDSGCYVNWALSYSFDNINDKIFSQELDYEAALTSLKKITDHVQSVCWKAEKPSEKLPSKNGNVPFYEYDEDSSGTDTSYHTACSTPCVSKSFLSAKEEFILGSEENDINAANASQLLMLCLSPIHFSSAYLLFKFMTQLLPIQVYNNQVRNIFVKMLLCGHSEASRKRIAVEKIADIMLIYHDIIFSSPSAVESDVMQEISKRELAKCEIKGFTYCQQVSTQEFEDHTHYTSHRALSELLDTIVQDHNISSKERKRWLKSFKASHPEIYSSKFPTTKDKEKIVGCSNSLKKGGTLRI